MTLSDSLTIVAGSAAAAWLGGILVYRLLLKAHIMDVPNARSSHEQVVVRGGGLAILLVLFGAWMVGIIGWLPGLAVDLRILLAVLLVAAVSFVDDVRPLPFWARLPVHGLAAVLALWGLGMKAADSGVSVFVLLVAWIWLVGYANAFNFMDGINGLAVMQAVIAGLFGAVFCWVGGESGSVSSWVAMQLLLAGAALGFLPHNFPRARMFLGDVGSVPIGFLLALATVAAWQLVGWRVGVAIGALHLNFLLDTTITMARRFLRGERIHEAHREHFYQRLLRSGKSHLAVTSTEALLQLGFGVLLLVGLGFSWPVFVIVVVAVCTGWLLFFRYCEKRYRIANSPG